MLKHVFLGLALFCFASLQFGCSKKPSDLTEPCQHFYASMANGTSHYGSFINPVFSDNISVFIDDTLYRYTAVTNYDWGTYINMYGTSAKDIPRISLYDRCPKLGTYGLNDENSPFSVHFYDENKDMPSFPLYIRVKGTITITSLTRYRCIGYINGTYVKNNALRRITVLFDFNT